MANITKKVTKRTGATQVWNTATDLDDGGGSIGVADIFRVETSLGKPAANLSITTGAGAVSIRINSYYMTYPNRTSAEFFNADMYTNLALGVEIHDVGQNPIIIPASTTWEWKGEVPIRTIEIVTKASDFTVIVS